MRRIPAYLAFSVLYLLFQSSSAKAQDILVPAGTLLRCTLDEPNFSSATADIGDPVICHLSTLRQFGQNVFPRGSYLGGHLEADKEPGHFVGKGYLQLVFDRIGFPTSDLPVPAKVIAAKGYKVDRHGDIIGRGHATRDVVEWLIPPLWPWKIITLPAKGPRPTLKGEEQITVRLMDDIQVPRSVASAQNYDRPFAPDPPHPYYWPQSSHRPPLPAAQRSEEQARASDTPRIPASGVSSVLQSYAPENSAAQSAMIWKSAAQPSAEPPSPQPPNSEQANAEMPNLDGPNAPLLLPASLPAQPSVEQPSSPAALQSSSLSVPPPAPRSTTRQPLRITWLALKLGDVYAVTNYRIHQGSVSYVLSSGARGSLDITAVDWRKTSQLNAEPIASSGTTRASL